MAKTRPAEQEVTGPAIRVTPRGGLHVDVGALFKDPEVKQAIEIAERFEPDPLDFRAPRAVTQDQ